MSQGHRSRRSGYVQSCHKNLTVSYMVDSLHDGLEKNSKKGPAVQVSTFTRHVEELLQLIDLEHVHDCRMTIDLTVKTPYSRPSINCSTTSYKPWCAVVNDTFNDDEERVMPYNLTLGISLGDYDLDRFGFSCLRSSAPNGTFCMTNFLENRRFAGHTEYKVLPWENRSSLPIWRGTPWVQLRGLEANQTDLYSQFMQRSLRLQVVDWSIQHPTLLDARISRVLRDLQKYFQENATNGLHKFMSFDEIPPNEYYSNYQVAVVLGGIGAAFRTGIHLSTSTAVVLQDFHYEEWFTKYMTPWVHYIPLARDLSDLNTCMQWVADNPEKVHAIAKGGYEFYHKYLSFERNQEHLYELLYKLAVHNHSVHETNLTHTHSATTKTNGTMGELGGSKVRSQNLTFVESNLVMPGKAYGYYGATQFVSLAIVAFLLLWHRRGHECFRRFRSSYVRS